MGVVTAWRIYKVFRISQAHAFTQAAVRPAMVYLARSWAVGTAVGLVASAIVVEWIDEVADPRAPHGGLQVGLQNFGGPSLTLPSARQSGLRTTDEAASAINTAIDDTQKWTSWKDLKEGPAIIGELVQQGGLTLTLGVTAPTIVYKVLDKQITRKKTTFKVGLQNFGGPSIDVTRPTVGGVIVGISKALAIL